MDSLQEAIRELKEEIRTYMKETDSKIRVLEDWKLKFTAYTSIAIIIGTFLSNMAIPFLKAIFLK